MWLCRRLWRHRGRRGLRSAAVERQGPRRHSGHQQPARLPGRRLATARVLIRIVRPASTPPMPAKFLELATTPSVRSAQTHYHGRTSVVRPTQPNDPLGPEEAEFIHARDSFYLSTVSEDGWPYLQH